MEKLLHGRLDVVIYEVDKLHTAGCNLDFCREDTKLVGKNLLAQVKSCVLCQPEIAGLRLYATVDLDRASVGRTRVLKGQRSKPQWNKTFHIYCAHSVSNIIFTLKGDNRIGATLIGRAYVSVDDSIIHGKLVKRWIELVDEDHHPIPGGSKIFVSLQFTKVHANDPYCPWSGGISTSSFTGIPHTFFAQRRGCKVTLYQDADNDSIPCVPLPRPGGPIMMESGRCWEDIFIAIKDAKHFIYIAGWSVYTEITLVRIPTRLYIIGNYPTNLGELLKIKADEGVTVLLLIWDDKTSAETNKGLMGIHGQETFDYFRKTKVRCVLCPRKPDVRRSMLQNLQIPAVFTHHQKLVVVDSENIAGGNSRKRTVISFIGGIDLCDGRYDIPEHPLFSTINTIHKDDFHQPNFPGASINKGGPREPWHDIHCKLEGPVAWDVLYNFEQRWLNQVGEEFLVPLETLDQILVPPSDVISPDDTETWNVQLFRSIDGGPVHGFPQFPDDAAEFGLVSGENNVIDRSIQDAYIHAIRRAQNFIYIENQYFIGSSYGWKSSDDIIVEDTGALHLIPKELSLKIVSKIEADQRFSVYIVIPMWPEGVPESATVQAKLDWQRRTMEMMYIDIAETIKKKGINAHPRDYLTFFCLGNRESHIADEYIPPQKPEEGSNYDKAQKNRRFMIYVHSKMMIVDDEYIIVGSANINQRSMDGGRDTEIAMGAYQPHHLTRGSEKSKGRIYGFRKALWREHLGRPRDEIFDDPEGELCIEYVNKLAHANWVEYASELIHLNRPFYHLLRYPVEVNSDGTITTLPDIEFFPDTKARILGAKSDLIPPILTT